MPLSVCGVAMVVGLRKLTCESYTMHNKIYTTGCVTMIHCTECSTERLRFAECAIDTEIQCVECAFELLRYTICTID